MHLYQSIAKKLEKLNSIAVEAGLSNNSAAIMKLEALRNKLRIDCIPFIIDGNTDELEIYIECNNIPSALDSVKASIIDDMIGIYGEIPIQWDMKLDACAGLKSRGVLLSSHMCSDCDKEMVLCDSDSILRCNFCGAIEEVNGSQLDGQFETKCSNSNYKPMSHMNKCLTNLYGIEKIIIPDKILADIRKNMERDGITIKTLKPKTIRSYLKQIQHEGKAATRFNQHITKIYCMITGTYIVPPTHEEITKITYLFDVAETVYMTHVCGPDSSNRPYYPFILHRILEIVYEFRQEKLRRIKEFIHDQLLPTYISNYETWFKIVDHSQGALKRINQDVPVKAKVRKPKCEHFKPLVVPVLLYVNTHTIV